MSYPQRASLRGVPAPNVLGAVGGFIVLVIGIFVGLWLFTMGVAILLFFVIREIAQARSPSSRAKTDAPALMEQIRGVTKRAYLQAPGGVHEHMERALMANIDKLEEIALGLRSEANDPNLSTNRQEQAAITFAKLLTDIAEAHAKFTELTGRVLPSNVLQAQAPEPSTTPTTTPST